MQRLSEMSTVWMIVEDAHCSQPDAAAEAQQLLMQRYGGAVRSYLLAILHDPEAADDLTQEFALCLVQGKFHKADPGRGRFRDYVKTVALHLASKHRQRQQRQDRPLPPDSPVWTVLAAPPEEKEGECNSQPREDLLSRTWDKLAAEHLGIYTVLRFRAEHPKMASFEIAQELSRLLGRPFSADGVRQALRRARERFAELLLDEVERRLDTPTAERLAEELGDLRLLPYCQQALERRTLRP
jgi:DNA-directed RNA polymerase specialized sigma24 family protein